MKKKSTNQNFQLFTKSVKQLSNIHSNENQNWRQMNAIGTELVFKQAQATAWDDYSITLKSFRAFRDACCSAFFLLFSCPYAIISFSFFTTAIVNCLS